ncbi:tol-pal system protein YbgF [Marinobacterium stanieri]|uniref:Cell division coordinator CpoB n=1 Tax=Marinobacterium stanieri TaxID=49186 RepID=A0A1N6RL43_9GAMM|nr:tol-pal system protein YbgF [Marinobacterium stanieri]SIQ29509.1 tol-pal system protein YbgF [Marinobacterium stanieri]
MIRIAKNGILVGLLSAAAPAFADVPVIEIREAGSGSTTSGQPVALGANSAGNEMVLLIQQLQDEVRSLRGTVEQQQRRLDLLEQQQRERYRDIDRRLSLLFQSLPADAALATGEGSATAAPSVPGAAESPVSADKPAVPESVTQDVQQASESPSAPASADQNAYEAAYGLIRQRDFVEANKALTAFINTYPNSGLIPNAWYWKGEVHLAQQQLEGARQAFTQVLNNYAEHSKAPDAMYKLGVLFGRSGDTAGAEQMMRKVIDTYPQSSASELARGYLTP